MTFFLKNQPLRPKKLNLFLGKSGMGKSGNGEKWKTGMGKSGMGKSGNGEMWKMGKSGMGKSGMGRGGMGRGGMGKSGMGKSGSNPGVLPIDRMKFLDRTWNLLKYRSMFIFYIFI